MAGFSNYIENAVLSWWKGTTFPAAPTTIYAALGTTAPSDDSGSGFVEVTGGSYARAAITSATGWSAISGGGSTPMQITNAGTITWPTPSASWGSVVTVAFYTASTGGNYLGCVTFAAQAVASGSTVSYAAGQLTVTSD